MARRNHVFLKNRSEIFLLQGLDERTQLNRLAKFDFARTRILRLESLVSAPMSTTIEPVLPDGRIGFCRPDRGRRRHRACQHGATAEGVRALSIQAGAHHHGSNLIGSLIDVSHVPARIKFRSIAKTTRCATSSHRGISHQGACPKRWTVTVSPISNEVRSSPISSGPL